MESLSVNQKEYQLIRLLGKGKGGISYLVKREQQLYVLKQIHHEPCDYYTFGNKIESEISDYHRLHEIGVLMPELYDVDLLSERIIKEYIEGDTVDVLIKSHQLSDEVLFQMNQMYHLVKEAGLNIDYYPTNFVVRNEQLYYIDYECNPYMEQWDFENWGKQYWSKTEAFIKAFGE